MAWETLREVLRDEADDLLILDGRLLARAGTEVTAVEGGTMRAERFGSEREALGAFVTCVNQRVGWTVVENYLTEDELGVT